MKILLVSQYFWPESFQINFVVAQLVRDGHQVNVLTGKPNYPQGRIYPGYRAWGYSTELHHGATIHRIPLVPRKTGAMHLSANYLSFVVSGLLFGPWMLRRYQPNVIFVYATSPILQAIPAIFLGWLKRCPVVLWVQDLWPESLSATGYVRNRWLLKMVEWLVRFIYRHCDLLLVQSRAFVEPVRRLAPDAAINYYPNSVEGSFANPAVGSDAEIPGLEAPFSVMFAGNIGSAQAVDVIVDAAALLKENQNIQFIVLGDGSRSEWMLQQIRERGLQNIHLPGRFPMEIMPSLMQKASALLVTLSDQPIFRLTIPNKVQAYLAAGRPILASLNGEGAELVAEAKAGLAVPAQDAQALADAVMKLYNMPRDERDAMGACGRAYYRQHFTHDVLLDQLIEHLNSARKRGKGAQ